MENQPKGPETPCKLTDYLMVNDPLVRKLNKKIVKWQDRLKTAIKPKQFRIYLQLEDVVNERLFVLVDRAWAAGVENGRRDGVDREMKNLTDK